LEGFQKRKDFAHDILFANNRKKGCLGEVNPRPVLWRGEEIRRIDLDGLRWGLYSVAVEVVLP